jgi:hypothetical protein
VLAGGHPSRQRYQERSEADRASRDGLGIIAVGATLHDYQPPFANLISLTEKRCVHRRQTGMYAALGTFG